MAINALNLLYKMQTLIHIIIINASYVILTQTIYQNCIID